MRTNIVIDDRLMAEVQRLWGFKTKREAVEADLQLLLRLKNRKPYENTAAN